MDIENDRFIDYRAPRAPQPTGRLISVSTGRYKARPGADKGASPAPARGARPCSAAHPPPSFTSAPRCVLTRLPCADWGFMYVPTSAAIGGQVPYSDSKVAAALEVARAADIANKTRMTSHTFAVDEAAVEAAKGNVGPAGEGGAGGKADDSVDDALAEWMTMRNAPVLPKRENPMYSTTSNVIGFKAGEKGVGRSTWLPKVGHRARCAAPCAYAVVTCRSRALPCSCASEQQLQ